MLQTNSNKILNLFHVILLSTITVGLIAQSDPLTTLSEFDGNILYKDLTTFELACGALPNEDFSGSGVTPSNALICNVLPISNTNGDCIPSGELVSGFSILGDGVGSDIVFLGMGLSPSVTTDAISSSQFPDPIQILFDNSDVTAVAMELSAIRTRGTNNSVPFKIDIYNLSNDLLGTTTITTSVTESVFFGLRVIEPIGRIVIEDPSDQNIEVIDNLKFGPCTPPIPSIEQWGLIILALTMVSIGLAFIYVSKRESLVV